MGKVIAVSGKGGVGKTFIASLLIRQLSDLNSGNGTILAIDADPDANLAESLGVKFEKTLGDIREEISEKKLPPGVEKRKFLDSKIFEIMVEEKNFDLLVMGRPEGPGCYCAVNHILREIIDKTTELYDYTIIDAEAGLEHLSRRTTEDVDILLIITDTSKKSFLTATKIVELANELKIKFEKIYLILNKVKEEDSEVLGVMKEDIGMEIIGEVPEDELVLKYDLEGRSFAELPKNSKAYSAIGKILEKIKRENNENR